MKIGLLSSLLALGLSAVACSGGGASSTGDTTSTTSSSLGGAGGATAGASSGGSGGASSSSSASGSSSGGAGGSSSSSSGASGSSSSSSGAGPNDVSASFADVGLYIDCAKSGADQLQGTITVDFASTSGTTETVTLTDAQATIHNGTSSLDMTLALKWSAANSQPAGQIPAGGVNGVIYKEQAGAPAPAMDPCNLCPVHNNNVAPTLDVTMHLDHAGNALTLAKTAATLGCLNMF